MVNRFLTNSTVKKTDTENKNIVSENFIWHTFVTKKFYPLQQPTIQINIKSLHLTFASKAENSHINEQHH